MLNLCLRPNANKYYEGKVVCLECQDQFLCELNFVRSALALSRL